MHILFMLLVKNSNVANNVGISPDFFFWEISHFFMVFFYQKECLSLLLLSIYYQNIIYNILRLSYSLAQNEFA